MRLKTIIFSLMVSLSWSGLSYAGDAGHSVRLIPPSAGASRISGLSIRPDSVHSSTRFVGEDAGNLMTWVELDGIWPSGRGTLLAEADGFLVTGTPSPAILEQDETGKFHLSMPVPAEASQLRFISVSPTGGVQTETWGLYLRALKEQQSLAQSNPRRRLFWSPGAGLSFIHYEQTSIAPLDEKALTAKVAVTYLLAPPAWDLGGSFYYTALPLSSTGEKVRFLGVNARLGYALPSVVEPWKLTIAGGIYYTTMSVPGDAFGFRGMSGPQLFPVLRRAFKDRSALTLYGKFSPVTAGFGIGSPADNRELAFGGAYTFSGGAGRPSDGFHSTYSVTWDFADLAVKDGLLEAHSRSFTLGFSLGL